MPIRDDRTVRKNFTLPRELWERIAAFRFEHRIGTEAEALRRLLEAGLARLAAPSDKPEIRGDDR